MKKIAVLGSTGMAGHLISRYLENTGFDIYRISRSEQNSSHARGIDVTDIRQLSDYMNEIRPDVIVNCVGLLQKTCEARPDLAAYVNACFPHYLENQFKDNAVKVIHLSTDCVFSGQRGGYLVNDLPDGRTFYDRSKALGELNNEKDLTFRMSIIGPDIDPKGTGLFNWFMKQNGTIHGFSNVRWNGITTLELAKAIACAIEQNLCGLYQLVPEQEISKYHLLKLIQSVFHKDNVEILEDADVISNKTLINQRTDFKYHVNDYPLQLAQMKEWIGQNKCLYPEYYFTLKNGCSHDTVNNNTTLHQ